jgi:hypothetical protein
MDDSAPLHEALSPAPSGSGSGNPVNRKTPKSKESAGAKGKKRADLDWSPASNGGPPPLEQIPEEVDDDLAVANGHAAEPAAAVFKVPSSGSTSRKRRLDL